jgi:hypothetical protein
MVGEVWSSVVAWGVVEHSGAAPPQDPNAVPLWVGLQQLCRRVDVVGLFSSCC